MGKLIRQDMADDLIAASRMASEVDNAVQVGNTATTQLRNAVEHLRQASHDLTGLLNKIEAVGRKLQDGAAAAASEAAQALAAPSSSRTTATERVKRAVGTQGSRLPTLLKHSVTLSELAGEFQAASEEHLCSTEEVTASVARLIEVVASLNSVEQGEDLAKLLRASLMDDAALDAFLIEV